MRRRLGHAAVIVAGIALVAVVGVSHAGELRAALGAVPLWTIAVAVGLDLVTLLLRSEAWRLTLAAAGGALGVFDLLPLGPGAPPSAALAAIGAANPGCAWQPGWC